MATKDTGGGQTYLQWMMSAWGWTMSVAARSSRPSPARRLPAATSPPPSPPAAPAPGAEQAALEAALQVDRAAELPPDADAEHQKRYRHDHELLAVGQGVDRPVKRGLILPHDPDAGERTSGILAVGRALGRAFMADRITP